MVQVLTGDLFDSPAQTLVNTVNTVGVMGKGIALEFKRRFPDMFADYVARCSRDEVRLGKPYLYRRLLPPWVLNFPTKGHWRSIAKLSDIVAGLEYLLVHYRSWEIESLAVPPLGCGEGQLEWRIVGPTLYRYLERIAVPVYLYAPFGTPGDELLPEFLARARDSAARMPEPERIPAAAVALVEILSQIEAQPYHYPVGRVMFQKLAYVATLQGLPTGLRYERSSYGPFAPEFKRLVTRLVNNGLLLEERRGRMFAVRVGPTFADARRAYSADIARWNGIIDRVVDLFLRVDMNEAEVLASVLFSASELASDAGCPTERDVVADVMAWKQRRRPPLVEEEVALTVRNLGALGWLNVCCSPDLPLPAGALEA